MALKGNQRGHCSQVPPPILLQEGTGPPHRLLTSVSLMEMVSVLSIPVGSPEQTLAGGRVGGGVGVEETFPEARGGQLGQPGSQEVPRPKDHRTLHQWGRILACTGEGRYSGLRHPFLHSLESSLPNIPGWDASKLGWNTGHAARGTVENPPGRV